MKSGNDDKGDAEENFDSERIDGEDLCSYDFAFFRGCERMLTKARRPVKRQNHPQISQITQNQNTTVQFGGYLDTPFCCGFDVFCFWLLIVFFYSK